MSTSIDITYIIWIAHINYTYHLQQSVRKDQIYRMWHWKNKPDLFFPLFFKLDDGFFLVRKIMDLLVCLANPEVSNWQLLFSQAAGLELPAALWVPDTRTSTRRWRKLNFQKDWDSENNFLNFFTECFSSKLHISENSNLFYVPRAKYHNEEGKNKLITPGKPHDFHSGLNKLASSSSFRGNYLSCIWVKSM